MFASTVWKPYIDSQGRGPKPILLFTGARTISELDLAEGNTFLHGFCPGLDLQIWIVSSDVATASATVVMTEEGGRRGRGGGGENECAPQ